jgi:LPS O-antigen subunit length determinant protein (WzzB/FepE family)
MSVSDKTYDDEIDLLSFIQTVWEGKWKIASIIAVSILSVFVFNFVKPNTTFTTSTDIKSITSSEFDKYVLFNSSLKIIEKKDKKDKVFNIFEITPKFLLSLYVEEIEEGSLLETGIVKYNLIIKSDFASESDYRDAIEKFASEIEVVRPIKEKNGTLSHHVLRAEYNDKDKWKKFLVFVNEEANRKVKASIIDRFATIVSVQNQKKDFAVKDIDIKIDNIKKDYDRKIKDRLAFLGEQAAIARKLDIQKNTIAYQRFGPQNRFVTNVKTDAPFYLRGYLAIEEEIKQITTRKDKNAFTTNLFKIEQQKRTLEQDKTIQRAIDLFNKTPLNQDNFKATKVKVATTDFEANNKRILYYALAIVFAGIIGFVYVLIASAFRNRRTVLTNS